VRRLLVAGAVALAACGSSDTAIVLEVVPGAVDAATLDEVVFRVSGPGLPSGGREARAALRGPGARSFPLSLALVQQAHGAGPFAVHVDAYAGGVVRATAGDDGAIAFEPGSVVRHRLSLRAVMAPGAPPPDAAPPPPDAAPPRPDAAPPPPDAAPPPPDAAPPPPTCMRALACDKGPACKCDPGCSCAATCTDKDCTPECRGAGTTCTVQGAGAMQLRVRCAEGAACEVSCGSPDRCEIQCEGARCLLRCEGARDCRLSGCTPTVCPGNVLVCGRSCP
jgi:hypothetical protein